MSSVIVDSEYQSLRADAIVDLDVGISQVVESNSASADSSIITLVAGMDIAKYQLIGLSKGLAILADYRGTPCIGIALDTATENSTLRIKIQGIVDMPGVTADECYLSDNGNIRAYGYEPNNYLQKVADKINDNQLLINISDFILML